MMCHSPNATLDAIAAAGVPAEATRANRTPRKAISSNKAVPRGTRTMVWYARRLPAKSVERLSGHETRRPWAFVKEKQEGCKDAADEPAERETSYG